MPMGQGADEGCSRGTSSALVPSVCLPAPGQHPTVTQGPHGLHPIRVMLTSAPAQTPGQVIACSQRQDGHWWVLQQVCLVCNTRGKRVWGCDEWSVPWLGLFHTPLDVLPLPSSFLYSGATEPAHLCSPGSSPQCHPLHRPEHGNLECPGKSSACTGQREENGLCRRWMGIRMDCGGWRVSAAPPYPGAGPPRSRLYTCRGLSR